jgi:hypothetical protein
MSIYDAKIKIDRDDLDGELVRQPSLFLEVAQDYAQAVSVRDGLKEALESTRASVDLRIRKQVAEMDRKVTEATIKAEVETERVYAKAVRAYLTAKEAADQLLAVREAFGQRAFVLKDLCVLWVAGYYSTSAVKGKDPASVQDAAYERRRATMAQARVKRGRERL